MLRPPQKEVSKPLHPVLCNRAVGVELDKKC
jgi:hypothetical protein